MRSKFFFILIGLSGILLLALLWRTVGLVWLNLPGLVLVVGGTLLASVIGHSAQPVRDLLRRLPTLFHAPATIPGDDYKRFLQVADLCRRGNVRSAEKAAMAIQQPFLRAGTRLALDRHNGEELGRMLQWRIRRQKESDNGDIRILRTMATFAPAFGMLGTLLGLVWLLGDLGQAGLDYIGVAMGFALMSTLYGLLAANLLFRPLALKLEDRSRQQLLQMNFLMDAILMLYERQHPVLIGEFLNSMPPEASGHSNDAGLRPLSLQRLRA